jgi:urease accessory protein
MRLCALLVFTVIASTPALLMAHVTGDHHHGSSLGGAFGAGLLHPLTGLDHLLAMVALGLWISSAAARERLFIAGTFAAAMLLGGALSFAVPDVPAVEFIIASSVIVLGLLVATARRSTLVPAIAAAAGFALFHGYAHGTEMGSMAAVPYFAGFAATSAALVAGAAWLGTIGKGVEQWTLQPVGAAIATVGIVLIISGL